jgi:UDP-N-acetylmuramoyl-L-alanyl-D-glutamate--2,6-diaminopimelate ligase
MKKIFNKLFGHNHPVRLFYHKLKAMIAAFIYGFPANNMVVIGVTGTNGKTTTCNLITEILQAAGNKVGMATTVNFQIAGKRWVNNSKQSTQSPFVLQKMLKQMVEAGCRYAVLEVTSHALVQERVWGINFDLALMTNMSHDHIDYHGSFEEYRLAKGKLFEKVSRGKRKLDVKKVIVLNKDDENFSYFNQFVADRKVTYGMKAATIFASSVKLKASGSEFDINLPNRVVPVKVKLPGEYNVYNCLAAAAACVNVGILPEAIQKGLSQADVVPGRFEAIENDHGFDVIVDYAHNPDSLENLFALYKGLARGRLLVVFGATGGGRDTAKRPVMGEIADRLADEIFITNDDPYREDPNVIIEMVAKGIKRKEGENFWKIPDRREAIRLALYKAQPGDVLIVAGKGAEEVMVIDGKRVPWNDKSVILELLHRDFAVELT